MVRDKCEYHSGHEGEMIFMTKSLIINRVVYSITLGV